VRDREVKRTRLCLCGHARVRADVSVLSPDNFITDATVRPSHVRPSGHRPTVRLFAIVHMTILHYILSNFNKVII
jgi:hypothetical protein